MTDPMLNATCDMIGALIGYDTVSHRSNMDLIEFVERTLAEAGVPTRRFESPDGAKANVLARFGPEKPGGVVLSGHSDVVPVEGQDWSSDPFRMVTRDGRLFGRGTSDMKSFIAVVMALAGEFQARALKVPVYLAVSYDEEVGCIGVRGMLPAFDEPEIAPIAVIVGEPTGMQVCSAHKGIAAFQTTVTGHQAHSSRTHAGVNAIVYAARIIARLQALADELRDAGDPANEFVPPHSTVHIGTIHGGTALNIIPKKCAFEWEIRALPDEDPIPLAARIDDFVNAEIVPEMLAVGDAPGIDLDADVGVVTKRRVSIPALRPEQGSAAESLAMHLAGANTTFVVSYGAEAGLFQEAGVPTVICGPGHIEQAHKPDEFIDIAQVDQCIAFMRRLMDWAEAR